MPGTYTHSNRRPGEVLTAAQYNLDHENHIAHWDPKFMGSNIRNVADLQETKAIGAGGAEVLPRTLEDRLQQIQHVLGEIGGQEFWTMVAPHGNSQTIALAAASYWYESGSGVKSWRLAAVGRNAVSIDRALRQNDDARILTNVDIGFLGQTLTLHIQTVGSESPGMRADLSDAFEQNGSFTLTVGNRSLTIEMNGRATSEPYHFFLSSDEQVAARALYNALPTSRGDTAGTLTLRDFTP